MSRVVNGQRDLVSGRDVCRPARETVECLHAAFRVSPKEPAVTMLSATINCSRGYHWRTLLSTSFRVLSPRAGKLSGVVIDEGYGVAVASVRSLAPRRSYWRADRTRASTSAKAFSSASRWRGLGRQPWRMDAPRSHHAQGPARCQGAHPRGAHVKTYFFSDSLDSLVAINAFRA